MIQAALWLWGLARALQRPLAGQTCPWCGRTDSTVGRDEIAVAVGETLRQLRRAETHVVGGDITVPLTPSTDAGQVAAEISRRFREQRDDPRR